MKKSLLYFFLLIVIIHTASAGITHPLPTELQLLKGESGRFKFQIQTIAHPTPVRCTYSITGEPLFKVSFDKEEVVVQAGTKMDVYGTVKVPRGLDYGSYSANFCVDCVSLEAMPPGTSVLIKTCDLPINVRVVEEKTRENMYIPEKPFEPLLLLLIIAACIIAVLLIIIFLLYKRRKSY